MKEIEFLTVRDLQEILHIGKSKTYDLCKLKGFPVIKIGSKTLIYKKEFYQWLEEHKGLTVRIYD